MKGKTPYHLFYIECGLGWAKLYEPLIELCKKENVKILQIKEKFGGLRFYVGKAPDKIYKAIDKAEKKSYKTCERCGNAAKLSTSGAYWYTLCERCNDR